MLALEVNVLSLEPGGEGGDTFVKAAVAANLDAAGHFSDKGVAAGVTNDVNTESANSEERGSSGHVGSWVAGSPPVLLMVDAPLRSEQARAAQFTVCHNHATASTTTRRQEPPAGLRGLAPQGVPGDRWR